MASNLNVSLLQRGDLLPSPTPSSPPASAASNTPTMSRSSSFHGQESKQLAFRGQSVKVILPDIPAEMIRWIDDVLSKVADIHEPEDEENDVAISKQVFPPLDQVINKENIKTHLPDSKEWNDYMTQVREKEILELGVVRVSPLPRYLSPTLPYIPPHVQMSNHHFANSIPPMNYATSPMMPYTPAIPSPNFLPHFQQYAVPQPITHALPTQPDWMWSGLGIATPPLQSQPPMSDWSTAVDSEGVDTLLGTELNVPEKDNHEKLPPSATMKRGYDAEDTASTRSDPDPSLPSQDTHDSKKQQLPQVITAPVPSKRPPFPFAVPRALPKANKATGHERASSALNPFASEFIFRAPLPKLDSAVKEFSPVHLQESSKSLFNVYAPEFNPTKPAAPIFGNTEFALNKGTLFPKATSTPDSNAVFIKPSPTKKIVPIVKPVEDEKEDDLTPEETESDTPRPRKQSRIATPIPIVTVNPDTPSSQDDSPDLYPQEDFNGYPAFWEHRLQESERKAQRDGPLTPAGKIARNLANEMLDEDTEELESEDVSDKENCILRDSPYLSEDTDDSIPGNARGKVGAMHLLARQNSAAQVEKVVKERLQPVLKGLEALQMSVQRLSNREKEQRRREEASDADDEDEEETHKKTGILGMERIRTAVLEALRQEKELFVASPNVTNDRDIKDLKSVIDSLKSKLLDAEDNLDREERRRSDIERRAELLSRNLIQSERDLDSKTEQLQKSESEIKDLQKHHDIAKRGWDDERHTRNKLDEIIKGIRSSLGQMTDKNSKLSQEVSTLQSVTVSQKDDISSLREEISKARGDNGKLSRERTQLKREVEDERARFANLQNELMETGRAVAEQETRWREELSAEKLRVQSLERSLADEERRIKKMEEECDKLGKIAEERGKLKAMVEASVSRERHLEIVREKLEKRVYAAEAQVKVAQEERARFEKEESTRSHRDREMLNQEIASLRGFVNKVQDEKSQIAVLYERERANFELQSVMIESLGRETKQVTQTGMEREKLLEAATRDLKESQSQVVALRQEITSLREKMDKKDVQTDSLRDVADAARADVVKKDKQIVDLEFIIASTTSPTKKSRDDEANLKLQRREKEILRLREMMAALIRDNEELIAQSNEVIVPEQQKKYIAMKNVLRAENLRRKALERELARALTKNSSSQEDVGRTPGAKSIVSFYDTPGSVVGGLDTPVSLKDTPVSMRGFGGAEDTPLKGKGVLAVE